MSDTAKVLDLEAIEARDMAARHAPGPFGLTTAESDRAALVAEVRRLRTLAEARSDALEQIRAYAHHHDQLGPAGEDRFDHIAQMAKEAP